MSRPNDPRYVHHKLKELRGIVGLSQAEFAQITGVNVDTIRALEIGRRNSGEIPDAQLELIITAIGACWNDEEDQWMFRMMAFGKDVPYTREHFVSFRKELMAEASERSGMIYYLLLRLLAFGEALPAKEVNGWFWRLDHFLNSCGAPSIPFVLEPQWEPQEIAMHGWRKMFPSLLKGEEKRFTELIERARQEQARQEQRIAASFDETEVAEKGAKPKPKKARRSPRGPADESKNT